MSANSLANLKPVKIDSTERAKMLGSLGGKANHKKRVIEKSITKMCADFLVANHKVKSGRKLVDMSAEEIIIESIIGNLRAHGTGASVSMLDRIKEYTEGKGSGGDESKKDADLLGSLLGGPRSEEQKQEGE